MTDTGGEPVRAGHARLVIHTDGAARGNPGPAGLGAVLKTPDGAVVAELAEYLGVRTNNHAEWRAVEAALTEALRLGARRIDLRTDSQLVARQIIGAYRVKHPDLAPIHASVMELLARFDGYTVGHVPRELNREADALSNVAIDQRRGAGAAAASDFGGDGPGTAAASEGLVHVGANATHSRAPAAPAAPAAVTEMSADACVICAQGRPSDVIVELPAVWVTAGHEAPLPGYVCLIAKRHVREPFELPDAERRAFWDAVDRVAAALAARLEPKPVKLNYEIHGNTIPHLHLHLFPRTAGDRFEGRPIDGRESVPRSDEELEAVRRALRGLA